MRRSLENQLREAGVGSVPKTEFDDLCSNLLASKSDSTVKKYKYCEVNNYSFLPGAPIIVALYLSGLKTST